MRIYLIRHGETIWNRENRTQGWTDIALNANGRRHAAAIAQAVRDVQLDAVYSSSLSRAIATAEAIAAPRGLRVIVDPDLRELHQGTLDGLTWEELRRDHAPLLAEWNVRASTLQMPGGESMTELQERAWQAIQRIVAEHERCTVAVVSHNLAIVTVLCRVMGIDLDSFRRIRQDVAAINLLEFGGPHDPHVVRMNDTGHLVLGKRIAAMLAGLLGAVDCEPVDVDDDDLATIMAAARGVGDDFRVVSISDLGQLRKLKSALKESEEEVAADSYFDPLRGARAMLAVLGQGSALHQVGSVVLRLRLAATALGYGTATIDGDHLSPSVLAELAGVRPPWRLAALLTLGLTQA